VPLGVILTYISKALFATRARPLTRMVEEAMANFLAFFCHCGLCRGRICRLQVVARE
jgi:hypothetical protein